ncbi:futalosine hydrolase [Peterkaempfera sp. SMS 1(5)a]|uniref:futalosine hydrolase n=1 Tax=Peterkaempfera podocarpi TaxID=3232308 RepID=UPI003670A2BE
MSTTPHGERQPGPTARLLVVTAVQAEADRVTAGLRAAGGEYHDESPQGMDGHRVVRLGRAEAVVLAAGVGPAAAAAGTAAALALVGPFQLVCSAGIAGGFAEAAAVGATVVADAVLAADLGATTPDGFSDVTELGFGTVRHTPPPAAVELAAGALRSAGITTATGPVLTVSTVTGTAARAAELAERHPGAAAEAMEGFGVAEAAARFGLPVLELRTVSNPVGPRDRAAWRIGEALVALEQAFAVLPYRELIDTAAKESG